MTSRTVDSVTTGGFERIAYHEAGHVAARRHFERAIFLERGYVLINTAGGYGQTGLSGQAPPIDHPSIVTAMAGRAAEAIRYPDLKRAELALLSAASDEPLARRYIRVLCGDGLSDDDIADRIKRAEVDASRIVRGVWVGVKTLAETLLARLETEAGDAVELTGAEALHVMDTALSYVSP
jgi:hypothetical protein